MNGPSKQAVIDLILQLQNLDKQNPTPTTGLNDQTTPKLSPIQTALSSIQKTYTSTIDANTSPADSKLTALRNRLNAAAAQGVLVFAGSTHLTFAEGGMVPGGRGHAVPAVVHGGEYVLPTKLVDAIRKGRPPGPMAMPSAARADSAGSGQAVVININGAIDPYNTARQIQTILARGGYVGFSAKAA